MAQARDLRKPSLSSSHFPPSFGPVPFLLFVFSWCSSTGTKIKKDPMVVQVDAKMGDKKQGKRKNKMIGIGLDCTAMQQ